MKHAGGKRQTGSAERAQNGQYNQRTAPAQAVGGKAHHRSPGGRAAQSGGDHHAQLGLGKTRAREIYAQQHARQAHAQRAKEGRSINHLQVSVHPLESSAHLRRKHMAQSAPLARR